MRSKPRSRRCAHLDELDCPAVHMLRFELAVMRSDLAAERLARSDLKRHGITLSLSRAARTSLRQAWFAMELDDLGLSGLAKGAAHAK